MKVYWFTGLSGSGKTTLGIRLKKYFDNKNISSFLLDGDDLRLGLSSDLQFSDDDRKENMRRAMEMAKLLLKNKIIPIVSLISPFESERIRIKNNFIDYSFNLIYLDIDIEKCRKRDPKGLYKKKLKNFTGIDSIFEIPKTPNLILNTDNESIDSCLAKIINL